MDCLRPPAQPSAAPAAPAGPFAPTLPGSRPRARPHWIWTETVLRPIAQVRLPGPAVRFDYQSGDTARNRLYISHMGAGGMVVFDVQAERVIRTVRGLPEVTGVLAVPALRRVYASVTGAHAVAVVNDSTFRVVGRVGPIGFPDGMAYAPAQRKVYVSDESGGGEVVIDGVSNRAVTTIPIGGEAGNTVYDAGSHCILVAVQTTDEIVAIDPRTDRIAGRYHPAGAAHPHGLLVDTPRRLLFVANEGNATVSVVDLRTMRVVDTRPVGAHPDVLALDPGWRRLYVASESGVVSVFTETDRGLALDGAVTIAHAHSVSVDPRSHLVYFPLQNVGGRPMLWVMAGPPPSPGRRDASPELDAVAWNGAR